MELNYELVRLHDLVASWGCPAQNAFVAAEVIVGVRFRPALVVGCRDGCPVPRPVGVVRGGAAPSVAGVVLLDRRFEVAEENAEHRYAGGHDGGRHLRGGPNRNLPDGI